MLVGTIVSEPGKIEFFGAQRDRISFDGILDVGLPTVALNPVPPRALQLEKFFAAGLVLPAQ
jgi:hypothetical protein